MFAARRLKLAALACLAATAMRSAGAQQTQIVDEGGLRYEVTRQVIQRPVAVPEMRDQQQTIYRQQVTTENVQHQQVYSVPVTQYQLVSRMHNRWNPFSDPYYTYEYEPVTTWTQQTATVQIPVSRVTWAPETRTVQAPTTTYRTANEEVVHRRCIGPTPTAMAAAPLNGAPSNGVQSNGAPQTAAAGPSASLAARPSAPASSTPSTAAGQKLTSDPPAKGSGWQPPADSRYR